MSMIDTPARLLAAAGFQLQAFNEQFWLPERGYFAVALDKDKKPVDALASNMGHCLWTGIIDNDKAAQVAEHLVSTEMFTGWGIRRLHQAWAPITVPPTTTDPSGPTTMPSPPPGWTGQDAPNQSRTRLMFPQDMRFHFDKVPFSGDGRLLIHIDGESASVRRLPEHIRLRREPRPPLGELLDLGGQENGHR
jgi:hypothetical protein